MINLLLVPWICQSGVKSSVPERENNVCFPFLIFPERKNKISLGKNRLRENTIFKKNTEHIFRRGIFPLLTGSGCTSRGWRGRGSPGSRCSSWSRWPTSSSGGRSSLWLSSTGTGSGWMQRSPGPTMWVSIPVPRIKTEDSFTLL